MLLDAGDFRFQRLDPFVQLGDGDRTEVLLDEQGQRILRLAGKEVILVHGRRVVVVRNDVNSVLADRW